MAEIVDQKVYIAMRLSALGDVAMVLAQLRRLALAEPEAKIILLTKPFPAQLLDYRPLPNLHALVVHPRREGGILGLWRLAKRLHLQYPHAVFIDMHQVLRSLWLKFCFKALGHPCYGLRKPRAERRVLLNRGEGTPVRAELYVPSMHRLYEALLLQASSRAGLADLPLPTLRGIDPPEEERPYQLGLAPYARYTSKTLPDDKLLELIELIEKDPRFQLTLYGAPGEETNKNRAIAAEHTSVHLSAAHSLAEELEEMEQLSLMISMDSANMHLASLASCRVLSVWCATHPACGFMGYGQRMEDAVCSSSACSPSSIFGNEDCSCTGSECRDVPAEKIYLKVLDIFGLSPLSP